MNFALAEEHQMLKDLVRKFVDAQLMPLESDVMARETAGKGSYLTKEEQARVDLVSKDLGLWGLDAPEEVGGMNLPMVAMVGVGEELNRERVPEEAVPQDTHVRPPAAGAVCRCTRLARFRSDGF